MRTGEIEKDSEGSIISERKRANSRKDNSEARKEGRINFPSSEGHGNDEEWKLSCE